MKKNELTFDEAWEYLMFLKDIGFKITDIAKGIGTDRTTLSGIINNIPDRRTGKETKLPERCKPLAIKFVETIQFDTWRKEKLNKT